MQLPPRLVRAATALLTVGSLLIVVPAALAHRGSPASVASDYEARLTGFRPAVAGLRAVATGGDINLVLHVPAGHTVIVLGVEGEPFLRFSAGRVYANERSPTAPIAKVLPVTEHALHGTPLWHELRRSQSLSWHERRLRPMVARRNGLVSPIAIPLRVDGAPVTLTGASWYAGAPTPLTWIGPVALLALLAGAAFVRRDRLPPWSLVPIAVVAVCSVVATSVGSTLYAPHSTAGASAEIAAAALLGGGALVALVLVRGSQRPFVATAVGGLCVLFAISTFPILTHGYALSRLPTDLARLAAASALVAGGVVLVIGGIGLAQQSGWLARTPAARPGRRAI